MGNKNHRSPTPTGQGLVRGALTTYTSGIVHAAGWLSRLLTLSCVTEAGRKALGQRARALYSTPGPGAITSPAQLVAAGMAKEKTAGQEKVKRGSRGVLHTWRWARRSGVFFNILSEAPWSEHREMGAWGDATSHPWRPSSLLLCSLSGFSHLPSHLCLVEILREGRAGVKSPTVQTRKKCLETFRN